MNTTIFRSAFPAQGLIRAATVCTVLACASWTVLAHDGEDHSGDAPPAVGHTMTPRAYAQTEDFELVAQLRGTTLTMTLDSFATNAPVVDAQIEVESGTAFKALAQQIAPGVYAAKADALATPGHHALSFSVQTADTADLLAATLDTVPSARELPPPTHGNNWTIWVLAGGMLTAGLALAFTQWRKRQRGTSIHTHL